MSIEASQLPGLELYDREIVLLPQPELQPEHLYVFGVRINSAEFTIFKEANYSVTIDPRFGPVLAIKLQQAQRWPAFLILGPRDHRNLKVDRVAWTVGIKSGVTCYLNSLS